jgi:diguanylate cyclase (GGDEF)-like protein
LNLKDLRPSFTVYLIGSDVAALATVTSVLSTAGYVCMKFEDLQSALAEVYANPPHFVVMDVHESRFDLRQAFKDLNAQLPESHLYLLASIDERPKLADFFSLGLYDVLWTPPIGSKEWVKALDRASERDYFMYMVEQKQSAAPMGLDFSGLAKLQQELAARANATDCVNDLMEFGSALFGGCGALYLKYHSARRVLTAVSAVELDAKVWKGTGVDLSEDTKFRWPDLREPRSVPPIAEMIHEVLGKSEYQAVSMEYSKELAGILIFFADKPKPEAIEMMTLARDLTQSVCGYLEMEKRLHSVSQVDDTTDVLNRQHFIERIRAEIVRSRRTERACSLLIMALDDYGTVISAGGAEEGQIMLKMFARIFGKHSRVNDILARTGSDEFALLLCDTDRDGAVIKAERLRRMIEAGDFSKTLISSPKLTISIGISEYPTLCRDADDLMQSADEALFQVRSKTNRVCVARAPNDFDPDFIVPKKLPEPPK